jgi:N-acetylmuramoyl-L-alanine amidase
MEALTSDQQPSSLQEVAEAAPDQVIFRIQVASSRNPSNLESDEFKGYENLTVVQDGRWYKYLVGGELDYNTILTQCSLVKSDFPDAFVVALKNGSLIPLSEAIKEINR